MPTNINRIHQVNLESAAHEAKHYVYEVYTIDNIKPYEVNMTDLLRCAELLGRIEALDTSGTHTDIIGGLRELILQMRRNL